MYRRLLREPHVGRWSIVTVLTRFAVAAVPLGCVLLGKQAVDSYSWGAIWAGCYAAGEALGAVPMSRRFDRHRLAAEVARVVVLEALLLLALVAAVEAGWLVLAATAACAAGSIAAGVPGAMRGFIASRTPKRYGSAGLALDSSISQAMFMVGPAVAAGLAVVNATYTFLLLAAGLAGGAAVASRLPQPSTPTPAASGDRAPMLYVASKIRVGLLLTILIMALVSVVDATLAARVAAAGVPSYVTGLLLAGFAGASILGGLAYGSRTWPGSPRAHSTLSSTAFSVILALSTLTESVAAMAGALALGGVVQAPALIARNRDAQQLLAPQAWTVGFSVLYAAGGIGYALGSSYVAAALTQVSPGSTLMIASVAAIGITTLAGVKEHREPRHSAGQQPRFRR